MMRRPSRGPNDIPTHGSDGPDSRDTYLSMWKGGGQFFHGQAERAFNGCPHNTAGVGSHPTAKVGRPVLATSNNECLVWNPLGHCTHP